MEVQLTDFENAAFAVFIVLVTRTISAFGLHFFIPLSLVDSNMKRGHARDAVHSQKFFFRNDVSACKFYFDFSSPTQRINYSHQSFNLQLLIILLVRNLLMKSLMERFAFN